jgi:hypothetical protein
MHGDVLRDIDQHGAGTAGGGDVERFPHHARQVVHVGHQVVVFGDAAANLDDGGFLEGVGADYLCLHLPGDGHQGHAVQLRVGDGRHQVRRSRAARRHADARLAGGAGVSLGGESATLLVPRQDGADLPLEAGESLVQRHARPARIGEQHLDAMIDQRLDEDIGPVHHLGLRRLFGSGHAGGPKRWNLQV